MYRRLLAAVFLLAASPAFADSTVPSLTAATTLSSSTTYLAQGGTADRKLGFDTSLFAISAGNLTIGSGAITNAMLANVATTVNGTTCTLGSTCTVTAAAGTLTGTTLNGTVVNSSLTSVGTLSSLTMGGNIGLGTNSLTGNFTITGVPIASGLGAVTCANNLVLDAGNHIGTASCAGGGSVSITAATPNLVMTPSPITGTGTIGTTNAQNSPADGGSHSYTILSSDLTKQVILASTYTALSVPQATTTFGAGAAFVVCAKSTVTATPTTSTVNGLSSIKLLSGQCTEWDSDGTNWLASASIPQAATQTGTLVLLDNGFSSALPSGITATTQSAGDNSTKVATTAYVDAKTFSVSIGWVATVNPNNATVMVMPANATITSIVGAVETATGSAATVSVNKAASGTACSAGTTLHSGSFNANGTAATNQTLTVTTSSISSGNRLCLQTTGTTSWTGGTGIGGITVNYTIP